jgi:hypothetical protein
VLGRPVIVSVTWRFLLGAFKLLHIFVGKEKKLQQLTLQVPVAT